MYLILYCMTCFIVLYLIYVIYYACRFEKLLRAYVDCYKMYRLLNKTFWFDLIWFDLMLGGQVLKGVDMTTSLTPLIGICRTPQL